MRGRKKNSKDSKPRVRRTNEQIKADKAANNEANNSPKNAAQRVQDASNTQREGEVASNV
jgi:hypothetical protein